MRKLILVGVVFLLIVGGLIGFALYNLNDLVNEHKDELLAQVEQAIGRKVEIGTIGVTFVGGIGARLTNFALADDPAFSSESFVQATDLQVNVKLMPLLNQEIEVKRVMLHEPVIRVIRNADGAFNFESLTGADSQPAPTDTPDTADSSTARAAPFLVSLINITDGEIHYTDHQNATTLRISQLDTQVEDLSFDQPLALEIAAALLADQQNFTLHGQFGPLGQEVDINTLAIEGRLTLDPLDTTALKHALPQLVEALPPGLGLSGPLRLSSHVSGTAGALRLSDIELIASVFEASQPNVKVTGAVGPVGADLDALTLNNDIAFGPIALPQLLKFSPVAESLPPELRAEGSASVNVHVEGPLKNLAVAGTVEATESSIEFGDQFRKPQGMRMVLTTNARQTPETLFLQQATLQLHTLELISSGALRLGERLGMDLTLDSNAVDLAGWQELLPQLQDFSPTGQLEVHTQLKGKLGQTSDAPLPDITGTLELRQVSAQLAQLPHPLTDLNATVTFTGQGAEVQDTTARLGKSPLQLAAQFARFMPVEATYTLTAPELWLADLRPGDSEEPSTNASDVLKALQSKGQVWTENETLSYTGTVSSPQGTVANVGYSDFQAELSLMNHVAEVAPLSLQTFGGSVRAEGEYDMGVIPPQFSLSSQIIDIQLSEVFQTQLTTALQYIRGRANINMDLAGSGEDWEALKRALTGQGMFKLSQGALVGLDIAEDVLLNMNAIPGLNNLVSPRMREKYPAIFGGKETEFTELGGQLYFNEGKIVLDDVHLKAIDYTAQGNGWMDYDRNIDVQGQVILSKNLSEDIQNDVKVARYIRNQHGRVALPFTLRGTLPDAKPMPDVEMLGRQVQQAGVQKGVEALRKKGKLLDKILPSSQQSSADGKSTAKHPQEAAPTPSSPEETLQRGLQEGLKGLFGR